MATGTRTTDTFTEGLRKLLSSLTDLKTTDNADLPFIINLETMVLGRIRQGADQAMAGQGPPFGGPAPGPGPMPAIQPAGVPGLQQGPSMPNPDELRRVLAQ